MAKHGFARLDSDDLTVLLRQSTGVPELVYIGRSLPMSLDSDELAELTHEPWPHGLFDEPVPLTLLPETGQGFSAAPGIRVMRGCRELNTQLQLKSIRNTSNAILIELGDSMAALTVILDIRLNRSANIISSRNAVINTGSSDLSILWLASTVWKVLPHCNEVMSIGGRWGREFQTRRQQLIQGALVFENRVGRTSHASFPGLIMSSSEFSAQHGEAVAVALGWGGNHRMVAEKTTAGAQQLQAGELLAAGEIVLNSGQRYDTPIAYLSYSSDGENSLRHNYHQFFRGHNLPVAAGRTRRRQPGKKSQRPIHFNTWEACYFQQTEQRMLTLVDEAAELGAERFILDDGWMQDRTSDQRGLGNWTPCVNRYPNGLEPIISAVRAKKMQFGLWIEPEMVNEDSHIFREHPDWILRDGDRPQPIGRNQYALNLCREDVFNFLLKTITGLIERYQLDYLKWDMNRDLVHAVDNGIPANHRMTEAFYKLLNACRENAPQLEIEICASGGARADFGSALLADRIWTSDTHDPHERQTIHRCFSLFIPPEMMGSHIGSARSTISGRSHTMDFRSVTAMQGHLGLEVDPSELDEQERRALARVLIWYKTHRLWLHKSTTWYVDQLDPSTVVRLQVSEDKSHALLFVAQLQSPADTVPAPLVLPGLLEDSRYTVSLKNPEQFSFMKSGSPFHKGQSMTVTGALLMTMGLQMPIQQADTAAVVEIVGSSLRD